MLKLMQNNSDLLITYNHHINHTFKTPGMKHMHILSNEQTHTVVS